jgi:hypothetical protein
LNDKIIKDLSESAKDFLEIVYPKIKNQLGNGKLVPVQAVTADTMATLLDQYACIDAWYIEDDKGIRGIASRVQYDADYRTFTVRKSRVSGARTEFDKLTFAIKKEWLYPFWFCQAYIARNPKRLLSVAVCKTKDLVEYISTGSEQDDWYVRNVDRDGAATFYVVDWDKFRTKYPLLVIFGDVRK